ncbi:MAG: carboxypeptidase-like regulatory domain-containing protein [Firmicutes bacterium]|nr:carboxypeptidase-like regulatory domain-containing protein [Bacillota bacterium]
MRSWIRNLGFLVLLVAFCVPAWAQEASLSGTVTDPDGAAVPGATVTIRNKATGVSRTTTTGEDGSYVFPQVSPGTYRVEVRKEQFKTAVHENVVVPVGLPTTFNVRLEIGAIAETVVVQAETARVNTTDASIGNPFSGEQVMRLPSLNLDPSGLLSLQAGVTFVPGSDTEPGGYSGISDFDGRGGSVNGSRSDQTNITLDGVDVNDPVNGFAFNSVLRVPQASLAEFRVVTQNYNADQGRSSAAQVQLVTRSGSNELHGQAYYTHRNEIFNANDFFFNRDGIDRPKFRRHIYGAAAGGPIWPERLFIWGNYERLEEALTSPIVRSVPSNSFRDGVLIYQCQGGVAACPGGTVNGLSGTHTVPPGFYGLTPSELAAIDPLGIGPNAAAITHFRQYPAPNTEGSFDRLNIVGFNFASPINNDINTYLLRLDYNLDRAGNHVVWSRGILQDDSITLNGPQFPGLPPNQLRISNNRGVMVGYRSNWGTNLVNTFRYGLTRIGEQTEGNQEREFVTFRFISNLEDYGSDTFGRIVPNHQFRDDATYIWGNHTITFGGDVRLLRNRRFTNANSFHDFILNPSWLPNVGRNVTPGASECLQAGCSAVPAVAGAFRSAYRDSVINLLGIITQVNGNYNFDRTGATLADGEAVRRRFAVNEYELYVQDQWRMSQTLTLTYGVRYLLASPPWETNGNQVIPTPNLSTWFETRRQLMLAGLPTNQAPQIQFALGGPANNGPDYYPWDTNNWSPRVAVAWNPRFREGLLNTLFGDGKTVFRAGYALVYDRIGPALASSFDEAGSFGMSTTLTSLFGGCDEGAGSAPLGVCPRFAGVFNTAAARATLLPPPPPGGFPATPPGADAFGVLEEGAFAITSALDSGIVTPYAHTYNVSIGRELPGNLSLEFAYVGRSGRNLLMIRDLAMPADVCDPASGSCYFEAASELIRLMEQGQNILTLGPIPFWENLFPSFGPSGINAGFLVCDIFGVDQEERNGGFSATQVAYDLINCVHPDTTVFPWLVDGIALGFGFPGYMRGPAGAPDLDGDGLPDAPFAFFDDQFATLTAWSSIARSEYHALQVMVRKRMSHGIQFDFNYTLSKSLDHASTPERAPIAFGFFTGGYTGSTINAWQPDLEYSFSDFDMRHQVNANFIVDLPFGRGRSFAADIPSWLNHIIGGWSLSGIVRINSGLPANVINDRVWPTNWNLQGNATCKPASGSDLGALRGPCPATQNVRSAIHTVTGGRPTPNLFADPDKAFNFFRFTLPGQRGERNILRGDHYFNLDLGLGKTFSLPFEGHSFTLRWEVFNVTNSVYFDTVSLSADLGRQGTFGDYSAVLGGPRRMQITARYIF